MSCSSWRMAFLASDSTAAVVPARAPGICLRLQKGFQMVDIAKARETAKNLREWATQIRSASSLFALKTARRRAYAFPTE